MLRCVRAWKLQTKENRNETKKVVKIREMRNAKLLSKTWEFMLEKTYDARMKLRMAKRIVKFPAKLEYKIAIEKWQQFVLDERKLDVIVEKTKLKLSKRRLIWGLNKWIENHIISKEREDINNQISRLYFNKQAVKIFDMFRQFLIISRDEREKLQRALHYRTLNLTFKSMKAWKKYMADNYELFVKRRATVKRLRELK